MLRLELLKGAKGVCSTLAPAVITILIAIAVTFTSCQKEGFKDLTALTLEEMENTEFIEVSVEEAQEMILGTWHLQGEVSEDGFEDKSGRFELIFQSDNTLKRDVLSSDQDGNYTYDFLID